MNTVGAFDRHADGTLTPMRGSPFAAGGVGTGEGLASQGSLQLSSDGRYLLAVDAGSNQISALRITRPRAATFDEYVTDTMRVSHARQHRARDR